MKKKKNEKLNLFFSAFLILGYIVCTYFFMTLASGLDAVPQLLITLAVFVVFGLLLFYATRVGDGEPVKRFSPIILCVLVIPCLYAILANIFTFLPLHDQITEANGVIFILACIGFGYGIPYTFLSGFEIKTEEDEQISEQDGEKKPLEGGIMEELLEVEQRDMDEPRLIEREKGEFPSEDISDEEDAEELKILDGEDDTASDNAEDKQDKTGLQEMSDKEMKEPELIDGEGK